MILPAGFLHTKKIKTFFIVSESTQESCQKWICTFEHWHPRCFCLANKVLVLNLHILRLTSKRIFWQTRFWLWLTWRYSSTSTCPLWFVSISFKTSWICSPVTFSPPWAWGGVTPVRTQRAQICRGCPSASQPSLMKVPPQSSPSADSVIFELADQFCVNLNFSFSWIYGWQE